MSKLLAASRQFYHARPPTHNNSCFCRLPLLPRCQNTSGRRQKTKNTNTAIFIGGRRAGLFGVARRVEPRPPPLVSVGGVGVCGVAPLAQFILPTTPPKSNLLAAVNRRRFIFQNKRQKFFKFLSFILIVPKNADQKYQFDISCLIFLSSFFEPNGVIRINLLSASGKKEDLF